MQAKIIIHELHPNIKPLIPKGWCILDPELFLSLSLIRM